jgi:hypothetical protein
MRWVKSALVGALGSLVMFIIIMVGIHGTGIAPFNVAPSAAFLVSLGIPTIPLALVVHFGYGALGSLVLVGVFRESTNWIKGIGLALFLWLVMMVIYSPIIGWGMFGSATVDLSPKASLYLEPGLKYPVMTLILHLIYGGIIGWLNPYWTLNGGN